MKGWIMALLVFAVLLVSPTASLAKTSPDPVTVVEKRPEYLLPYPGILPDHPLYFLKQIRDAILDRLIVDQLRKTEFLILQADKRLAMGKLLVEQGKGSLAETTVSKGSKYLARAVSGLSAFKSTGRPVPASTIDLLTRSIEKHIEELTALFAKTSGAEQAGIKGTLEFVQKLVGEVEKLK